jgi:hypothetical protein
MLPMSYEIRKIVGWRCRMETAGAALLERLHNAPARTVYINGLDSADAHALAGKPTWFHRIPGPERGAALAELQLFRAQRKLLRLGEETEEQRAERRAKDSARNKLWRANQPPEWHQARKLAHRLWRENRTEEQQDRYRAVAKARLQNKSDEWREARKEWARNWYANRSEVQVKRHKARAAARMANRSEERCVLDLEKRRARKEAKRAEYNARDRASRALRKETKKHVACAALAVLLQLPRL